MRSLYLALLSWLTLASLVWIPHARAGGGDMDLALERLSQGDCAATLGGPSLVLDTAGQPTLRPDTLAFRELVAQFSSSIAPAALAPVVTSGPKGLDVSFETTVTRIDRGADYWQRGTRGRGAQAVETCAGRNSSVRPRLVSNRARFEKGLPFGLSMGATVGVVQRTGTYLVGADLKFALLEEVFRSRMPDLALRTGLTKLVGARELSLFVMSVDGVVSESFIVKERIELSPFAGAGLLWTRADTRMIDLTPNIDALACRAGTDPVCNASGLGPSSSDLAHDIRFSRVSQLRTRAFVGLWLRWNQLAMSSSIAFDALAPHVGDRGRGPTVPRQWTVNAAPAIIF